MSSSISSKKEEIAEIVRQELSRSLGPAVRQLSIEKTEIFSGPIPSPSACREYEQILPGFTERAVSMAEKAQNSDVQSRERSDRYLLIWRMTSILLSFTLALIIVGGAIGLIYFDKTIHGYVILVGSVAGVITAMRKGKSSKSEQVDGGKPEGRR